jgi:hypothetical protein
MREPSGYDFHMKTAVLSLISILVCWAVASADDYVVIAVDAQSNAISLGQMLNSGQSVDLSSGETLAVMSQAGTIAKFTGPYSGPISQTDKAVDASQSRNSFLGAVSELLTGQKSKSMIIGAAREIFGGSIPDSGHLLLTVSSSGPRCLLGTDVYLWRKSSDHDLSISLRSQHARATGIEWPSGQDTLKLPNEFLVDNSDLVMRLGMQHRRFGLHIAPGWLKGNQDSKVLQWMLNKGCNRQAEVLLEQVVESISR